MVIVKHVAASIHIPIHKHTCNAESLHELFYIVQKLKVKEKNHFEAFQQKANTHTHTHVHNIYLITSHIMFYIAKAEQSRSIFPLT